MAKYKISVSIDGENFFWIVIDNDRFIRNPTEKDLRGVKVYYYNKTNVCPICREEKERYRNELTDKSILYPGNARQFNINCENVWLCERHSGRYRSNPNSINSQCTGNTHERLNIISTEDVIKRKTKSLEERFWEKVIKKDDNECWLWTGSINSPEYKCGRIRVNGKNELTHRISWMLTYGNIPEEMNVLHKCDNPRCVNPNHLLLGTHQDNMNDMISKGRDSHDPEDNGRSKLTWDIVNEIRKRYDTDPEIKKYGKYNPILSDDYEISESQIGRILNNKSWKSKNK